MKLKLETVQENFAYIIDLVSSFLSA